jgi:hypothetical protein
MSRHIVRAFIVMLVHFALWSELIESLFHVGPDSGITVLAKGKTGRCVRQKDVAQANLYFFELGTDLFKDFICD